MSFATKHQNASPFDCDTEGFEFLTLKQLYTDFGPEPVYPVRGFFINHKSKFGDHPVCISEKFFIDFPKHMTETVVEIMHDPEDIADIKRGAVGFTIRPYEKDGATYYSVDFVDVDPEALPF